MVKRGLASENHRISHTINSPPKARMPKVCESRAQSPRGRWSAECFSHTFGMRPLHEGTLPGRVRWFPLHRYAVSLHHRLISLLPPGASDLLAKSDEHECSCRPIALSPHSTSLPHGQPLPPFAGINGINGIKVMREVMPLPASEPSMIFHPLPSHCSALPRCA